MSSRLSGKVPCSRRGFVAARNINPRQVATSKRVRKAAKPKSYVDGKTARAHVATAHLLA